MNEERALALENQYESPVWDSIEDTHSCYNNVMNHVIDNIKPESRCIVASHNVESCEMAIERMKVNGIEDCRVRFGQLKGFSDQLTGKLAMDDTVMVYKYLPYGPTETTMPYLVRRGQESKQVLRE